MKCITEFSSLILLIFSTLFLLIFKISFSFYQQDTNSDVGFPSRGIQQLVFALIPEKKVKLDPL